MKQINFSPYFFILLFLLALLSIPNRYAEKIQGLAVAIISPVWEQVGFANDEQNKEVIEQLKLEIQLLKNEIREHEELFGQETHQRILTNQDFVPARVIFRSPSSWNSSLWINVGKVTNDFFGKTLIAKNSPVIVGDSIIGVVDYVGKKQSRVRLITDSGLVPSVRSVRGGMQNKFITEIIQAAINSLSLRKDLFSNQEEKLVLENQLRNVLLKTNIEEKTLYLAKGELYGSSLPIWRSKSQILQGIGFNYDFEDDKGAARDLRTGKIEGIDSESISLVQKGDLLVTTGMDGVFPANFFVAEVIEVDLLKEGDYYYTLKATPTAGDLDHLTTLCVLPPVGFDFSDQAPSLVD